MAYDRVKDFEEPLIKTLQDIRYKQMAEYLDKLEELIDLELKEKRHA